MLTAVVSLSSGRKARLRPSRQHDGGISPQTALHSHETLVRETTLLCRKEPRRWLGLALNA